MGWVLGSLSELFKQGREPVPPTGIIPLGTGNDLSRSFGWVRVHFNGFFFLQFVVVYLYLLVINWCSLMYF